MKNLAFGLLMLVICPRAASALPFSYEVSFTLEAANLLQPLFGDIAVGAHFTSALFTQNAPSSYTINGDVRPNIFGNLFLASPTQVVFTTSDPAGALTLRFFFNTPLVNPLTSMMPKPNRMNATVSSELGRTICTPLGCNLGTTGSQSYNGEQFAWNAAPMPLPVASTLLLLASGLVILGCASRYRHAR